MPETRKRPEEGEQEPSDSSWRAATRQFAVYSHIGIMFPVAIALGFSAGYLLDRWLGTSPFLALAGLVLGVVAAIRDLLVTVARSEDGN
ncbi:MAG: AtpZ/AtpI family protein [Acidobacteriota bacterium]